MVAKDGITLTDAVSETFTDFLFIFFLGKKGSREACHYNALKFLTINIS